MVTEPISAVFKKGWMDVVLAVLKSVKFPHCFDTLEIPSNGTAGDTLKHDSPCLGELLFPPSIILLMFLFFLMKMFGNPEHFPGFHQINSQLTCPL